MMFLSRISASRAQLRSLASNLVKNPEWAVHQKMWELFGSPSSAARPFLFRTEWDGPRLKIFALSADVPAAGKTDWLVESKPFRPRLRVGDRLHFVLRANPTKRSADGPGRGKRHDVVMDAKRRERQDGGGVSSQQQIERRAGLDWLSRKAERGGFAVLEDEVRIDGYRQIEIRGGKRKRPIRFSTIELEGLLTITDPGVFRNTLASGIGSAKGFGCGLMLVRRV